MKISEITGKLDQFFKENPPKDDNLLNVYSFLNNDLKKTESLSEQQSPITLATLLEKMSDTNSQAMQKHSNNKFFSEMKELLDKAKIQLGKQKEAVKKIDSYLEKDKAYQEYEVLNKEEKHARALPKKYIKLMILKNQLETSLMEEKDYLPEIKEYQMAAQKDAAKLIGSFLKKDKAYQEYEALSKEEKHTKALPKKYMQLMALKTKLETSLMEEKDYLPEIKECQMAAQKDAANLIDSFLKKDKAYQEYNALSKEEKHTKALPKKYMQLMVLKTKLETSLMEEKDYLPEIEKYITTKEKEKPQPPFFQQQQNPNQPKETGDKKLPQQKPK